MSTFLMRRFRNKRASLLIEVLLAIAILAVSVTLIIQSMISSARAMDYSSDYGVAITLLEQKMQEIIQLGEPPSDGEGTFSAFDEKYQYQIKTSDVLDEQSHLRLVDFSVLWKSGNKENRVHLETYFLEKE